MQIYRSHIQIDADNWFRFAIPAEATRGFEASRLGSFKASRLTIIRKKAKLDLKDLLDLGSLWGLLWGYFVYVRVAESEEWIPKVADRRRMAHVMHIMSPCIRPKRVHKQEIDIFQWTLKLQDSHEHAKKNNGGVSRGGGLGHFGVKLHTSERLWGHFRYRRVTLYVLTFGPFSKSIHFSHSFWWFYRTPGSHWE